jgi:hypothetical protein
MLKPCPKRFESKAPLEPFLRKRIASSEIVFFVYQLFFQTRKITSSCSVINQVNKIGYQNEADSSLISLELDLTIL